MGVDFRDRQTGADAHVPALDLSAKSIRGCFGHSFRRLFDDLDGYLFPAAFRIEDFEGAIVLAGSGMRRPKHSIEEVLMNLVTGSDT